MGEWIDFRELRSKLKFTDVLDKYQIRLQIRSGGKQAIGPCPLPNHGGSKTKHSFSVNLEKGIFQCFSCEAKGNVLDFACLMEGRDPENGDEIRKVALDLGQHFKISQGRPPKSKVVAKPAPKEAPRRGVDSVIINAPLDFELKDLDPEHAYLEKRQFTPETIKYFGFGYCARGRMTGRIAIPLHNGAGKLVGYAGRLVDDGQVSESVPKYLFPGTRMHNGVTHEFKKTHLLYNAHQITGPVEDLIIVEGFPSVWWLTQHGFPNCVALMGSSISEEQASIALSLVALAGRVTIFPDGDAAGEKLAEQAFKMFEDRVEFRRIRLRDTDQPTNMSASELAELLREPKERPAGIGGGVSPIEDICELINQFPCLERFRMTPDTWDAEGFERQTAKFSSGELSVAQFILGVWNPTTAWKCGKFDLIEAAPRLDEEHRQVIIDWFSDPWWP